MSSIGHGIEQARNYRCTGTWSLHTTGVSVFAVFVFACLVACGVLQQPQSQASMLHELEMHSLLMVCNAWQQCSFVLQHHETMHVSVANRVWTWCGVLPVFWYNCTYTLPKKKVSSAIQPISKSSKF